MQQATSESKLRGMNLTEIMNTWTKQMGHPLVNLRSINSSHIAVSQKHFLLNKNSTPIKSAYKYIFECLNKRAHYRQAPK